MLDIIVKAGQPILHSEIVKQLAERGYDKKVAYKAISYCQQYKWIEHNLTTGYELRYTDAEMPPVGILGDFVGID